MGKKGKRHGRGGGAPKRSAARQSADGLEGIGSGGSRRTAGGAALGPPPAPTAEQKNPIMSGILAKTLPDLPVRTFRFPPNASPQQVFEVIISDYMYELNPRVLCRGSNDSTGILSV